MEAGMNGILHYRSPWLSLTVLCFGLGLLLIDLFAVNVALPAVGRSLGADLSEMEWIITVYVLMLGVFPVVMGRLGDLLGRRRIYLAGLFLFILASMACGMATDIRAVRTDPARAPIPLVAGRAVALHQPVERVRRSQQCLRRAPEALEQGFDRRGLQRCDLRIGGPVRRCARVDQLAAQKRLERRTFENHRCHGCRVVVRECAREKSRIAAQEEWGVEPHRDHSLDQISGALRIEAPLRP